MLEPRNIADLYDKNTSIFFSNLIQVHKLSILIMFNHLIFSYVLQTQCWLNYFIGEKIFDWMMWLTKIIIQHELLNVSNFSFHHNPKPSNSYRKSLGAQKKLLHNNGLFNCSQMYLIQPLGHIQILNCSLIYDFI